MVCFDMLEQGSWYTITGCGGDLDEWKKGYTNLMVKEGIGAPQEWLDFTGEEMNMHYNLTGDNAYPPELHFLAFPLDDLNVGKLCMFKLRMDDRWFDDIVANNAGRKEALA